MGKFFVVDTEADGPCPGLGNMTELGIVFFHDTNKTFHAKLQPVWPDKSNYEMARIAKRYDDAETPQAAMQRMDSWLKECVGDERKIAWSDNPAFDMMWVFYYSHHFLGHSPFGWSARRIADLYAGVVGDLRRPWKQLRDTPHDHNPVNDALGNAEALAKILRMMEEK